jgi:hypothetical protein
VLAQLPVGERVTARYRLPDGRVEVLVLGRHVPLQQRDRVVGERLAVFRVAVAALQLREDPFDRAMVVQEYRDHVSRTGHGHLPVSNLVPKFAPYRRG